MGQKPITTMLELLAVLYTSPFNSNKTNAVFHRRSGDGTDNFVREHFDDGKGHSGAFTNRDTQKIPDELFQEALREGFIKGVLEPGYVSEREFTLTDMGRMEYAHLLELKEAEKTKKPDVSA